MVHDEVIEFGEGERFGAEDLSEDISIECSRLEGRNGE